MKVMNKYKILTKIKNRVFGRFPKLSYSRSGEDLILEEILGANKFKGFYVDIGAFHPVDYSNTYKFYLKGWEGINVDANYDVIENFKKVRKNDININIAIGNSIEYINYYMFNEDSSMNTSSEEFMKNAVLNYKVTIKEKRIVKVIKLNQLLDQYLPINKVIDFMSIDVEGLDLEVLKTNDWKKYRAKVIVVETNDSLENLPSSEIVLYLKEQGYKQVAYSLVTMEAGNIYFVDIKIKYPN